MLTRKQVWLRVKSRNRYASNKYKCITFNDKVFIQTIPSRYDLFKDNLVKEIWYSSEDYKDFNKSRYYEYL